MKKKTRNILITIGGAGAASWLLKTFPGGDSLVGLVWGSLWGNPLLGLVAGAVTPNRAAVKGNMMARIKLPNQAQAQISVGNYAVLARLYRQQAGDAAAQGRNDYARELMQQAEAADAQAAAQP